VRCAVHTARRAAHIETAMELAAGWPQVVRPLTNLRHSHCALHAGSHVHQRPATPLQQSQPRHPHEACRFRRSAAVAAAATADSKPEWLRRVTCLDNLPLFNPARPHGRQKTTSLLVCCREVEADAAEDPDIARVLEGANGDPEVVRERVGHSHGHNVCLVTQPATTSRRSFIIQCVGMPLQTDVISG
jgi:hypothetical protein